MSIRKSRIIAGAAIIGGVFALSVGTGFAVVGPTAHADGRGGDAKALGMPGVVTVSEAHSRPGGDVTPETASWSLLTVAGTNVLGRDSNGRWTGTAAKLGGPINSINTKSCGYNFNGNRKTLGPAFLRWCVAVAPSFVGTDNGPASAFGALALVNADVYVDGPKDTTTGHASLLVLPSYADSDYCSSDAGSALTAGDVFAGSKHVPLDHNIASSRYSSC